MFTEQTQLNNHRPRVEPAAGDPMLPVGFRVVSAHRETSDTMTLELSPMGEGRAFEFKPGQFNMIYAFGVGEVPISISGDPEKTGTLVHTVRDVGAVSHAICAAKPGDTLGIRGPFGTSWPVESAVGNDIVVVAGGIGLAPLRPMIYHLQSYRERYGSVSILYGCRTPDDILFSEELHRLRGRFDFDVHVTVDAEDLEWRGAVGPVTQLIPAAMFDPGSARAFVCGPEIMMRFVMRELEQRALTRDRVYLSTERNMKCAVGFCGHCQFGPRFICKDGPVFAYTDLVHHMNIRGL